MTCTRKTVKQYSDGSTLCAWVDDISGSWIEAAPCYSLPSSPPPICTKIVVPPTLPIIALPKPLEIPVPVPEDMSEKIIETLNEPVFKIGDTEIKKSYLLTAGIIILAAYFLLKK